MQQGVLHHSRTCQLVAGVQPKQALRPCVTVVPRLARPTTDRTTSRHCAAALGQTAASVVAMPSLLLPVLGVATVALLVYKIIRLALADADLRLLSRGEVPAAALSGKTVWVTGASQGIGRMVAIAFAKRGARLILSARSVDRLQVGHCDCSYLGCGRLTSMLVTSVTHTLYLPIPYWTGSKARAGQHHERGGSAAPGLKRALLRHGGSSGSGRPGV
jgi:hypothetical protein